MATDSEMKAEVTTWHREDRLERLDRCRKYLYGEMIITATVNDAIKVSLEEARDRILIAEQDDMKPSAFLAMSEEDDPEDEE
jgi:hypothetical protein